jgi:hypothetical protein
MCLAVRRHTRDFHISVQISVAGFWRFYPRDFTKFLHWTNSPEIWTSECVLDSFHPTPPVSSVKISPWKSTNRVVPFVRTGPSEQRQAKGGKRLFPPRSELLPNMLPPALVRGTVHTRPDGFGPVECEIAFLSHR